MASLWALLLNETPLVIKMNEAHSEYKIVNLFIGAITCPMCLSAHLFWIWILITTGSLLGMFLCPIPFWLTFVLKKYIFNVW